MIEDFEQYYEMYLQQFEVLREQVQNYVDEHEVPYEHDQLIKDNREWNDLSSSVSKQGFDLVQQAANMNMQYRTPETDKLYWDSLRANIKICDVVVSRNSEYVDAMHKVFNHSNSR